MRLDLLQEKNLEGKQAHLNLVLQNFLSPDAKNLESDYEKILVNFSGTSSIFVGVRINLLLSVGVP